MTREQVVFLKICEYFNKNEIDLSLCSNYAFDSNGDLWEGLTTANFFNFYFGATKGVIVPKAYNFVFKFDLQSEGLSEEYCEIEEDNYTKARKRNLGFCFAKCSYFDTYNGVDIYVQPKIDYEADWDSNTLTEMQKSTCSKYIDSSDIASRMSEQWMIDFIEYYNEGTFNFLLRFLEDNGINDLHPGNLGYMKGRPVIFDYSGYYEEQE